MGATVDRIHAETLRLLGTETPFGARLNVHTDIAGITITVRKTDGTVMQEEFESVFRAAAYLHKLRDAR